MLPGNDAFSLEDWSALEIQILRHVAERWGHRWYADSPFPATAERLALEFGRSRQEVESAVSRLWLHLRPFTLEHLSDGKRLDFGTITGLTPEGEKLTTVLLDSVKS